MSYSLESPCDECKIKEVCADGRFIKAARDTIHMLDSSHHRGSGTITHECLNFEKKEE